MVYKVLGLQVPKKVKETLKLKGVEFAEHWPVNRNLQIPHEVFRSTLGVFEFNAFNEIELLQNRRKIIEDEGPTIADCNKQIESLRNHVDVQAGMQKKYVEEIAKLKEKVHKWQKKHQDMKRTIQIIT